MAPKPYNHDLFSSIGTAREHSEQTERVRKIKSGTRSKTLEFHSVWPSKFDKFTVERILRVLRTDFQVWHRISRTKCKRLRIFHCLSVTLLSDRPRSSLMIDTAVLPVKDSFSASDAHPGFGRNLIHLADLERRLPVDKPPLASLVTGSTPQMPIPPANRGQTT